MRKLTINNAIDSQITYQQLERLVISYRIYELTSIYRKIKLCLITGLKRTVFVFENKRI